MQINIIWDDSVASAPVGWTNQIQQAVNMLDATIKNNISLNIRVGYGSANNVVDSSLTGSGGAYGNYDTGFEVAFGTVKSWLGSSITSALDQQAYINLSSSIGTSTPVWLTSSVEKALGVYTGSSSAIDGYIALGTGISLASLTGVVLHEITHALGRSTLTYNNNNDIDLMDFWRYGSTGVLQWNEASGLYPSYLSTDGGVTHLADFSTVSDFGDLSNSSSLSTNDSFNAYYSSSTDQYLTSVDKSILDLLGYNVSIASRVSDDLAGRGTSSIVLQSSSGVIVDWIMSAGAYQSGNVITTGASGWKVAGTGDFNGDGTSDMLMQSGAMIVDWTISNGKYQAGAVITSGATGYTVVGVGDFNGDRTSDILLQNGGIVVEWIMSAGKYKSGSVITTGATGYTVVGTGDLNGDGTSDILLQNGGTVVDWIMKNGAYQSGNVVTTGATGYTVVGTGDFNGDGTTDVLLQNGGNIVDWIMGNGKYQSGNVITTGATGWTVVGTGDYNGDGTSDILLQSGGVVAEWIMKNGSYQSGSVVSTGASGYSVVA